jgi:glutathione S-transferase
MLTLYHYWSSVCSQKVRLCLAEKNLGFRSRHINLFDFDQWDPAYVKLNPKGVVPTLEHDGKVVIESNVILEYLEDSFPDIRLRPADAYAQAQMRLWIYNSEEIAHPNGNTASHNPRHAVRHRAKQHSREELQTIAQRCPNPITRKRFLQRLEHGVSMEEEEHAYAALDYLLDQMEAALKNGPWLTGGVYSLADIAMAPFINRIEVLRRPEMVQAGRRPRIADWWMRLRARPAFDVAFSFANPDTSDPLKR